MIFTIKNNHQGRIMEAVLFVFFLLAFALVAPPHVVALTATGLVVASLVVRATARALSGVRVSLAAAFRAVVLTFLLSTLVAFAAMSLTLGAPPEFQHAVADLGANLLGLIAYTLGFRAGLGLSWQHAAIAAAAATLTIGACVWLAMVIRLPVLH